MSEPLAGRRVWLTRPAGQNETWANALIEAGAEVCAEPLLSIEAPLDPDAARDGLARAERADIVIACSVNAVDRGKLLRPGFAPAGALLAVGAATAVALAKTTGRAVGHPEKTDAEGLLGLPDLTTVDGQRIALLAGHGGRAALGDTLAARGAKVETVATYRRADRALSPARVRGLVDWADTALVTSAGALAHFCALVIDAAIDPADLPTLFAPSARALMRLDTRLYEPDDCRILPAMRADVLPRALAISNAARRQ